MKSKCKYCGVEISLNNLPRHLKVKHEYIATQEKSVSNQYYDTYYLKEGEGFCLECKKPTNYINLNKGYRKFCSRSCADTSKYVRDKIEATNIKRYNTKVPANTKQNIKKKWEDYSKKSEEEKLSIVLKRKKTCKYKYGEENYMCFGTEGNRQVLYLKLKNIIPEDIFKKIDINHIMEYGTPEFKYLAEITSKNKYGKKNFTNREKAEQTLFEKYGVTNPSFSKTFVNKINDTKIKRYGTLFPGGNRASKVSKELFTSLYCDDYTYFDNNPKEFCIEHNKLKYFPDYVNIKTKKIIEFFGDFWHGNPSIYSEKMYLNFPGKKVKVEHLWDKDKKRLQVFSDLGYNVKIVWEQDFRKNPEKVISACNMYIKGEIISDV